MDFKIFCTERNKFKKKIIYLFIWKFKIIESEGESKSEVLRVLVAPQVFTAAGSGASSKSPHGSQGPKTLVPFFAAFPLPLVKSWIKRLAAGM